MKKYLIVVIVLIFSFILSACTNNQKDDINMSKVNEVIDSIDSLPSRITNNDINEVKDIYDLYKALNDKEKELVENYDILSSALERVEYLEHEDEYLEGIIQKTKAYLASTIPNYVEMGVNKITLPTYYEASNEFESYTISIAWTSSDISTIDLSGNVKHDLKDRKVTLQAKLTNRKITGSYTFSVEVNVMHSDYKDISKGKIIAGYLYDTYPSFSASDLETLDIVYVCFAKITERNGEFSVSTSGIRFLNDVIELKNSGIRLILSIGGWSDDSSAWDPYKNASKTESGRKQVAESILSVLKQYHLDGVDMDWEYPSSDDKNNYTLLMKEIRDTLKEESENYLVTAAIPAGTWITSSYDLASLSNILDYVNVMSYDLDDGRRTSHMCALSDSSYTSCSAKTGVEYIARCGFDKKKIIIGAAFYGRIFYGVDSSNNGLGQRYTSKDSIKYRNIKTDYLDKLGSTIKKYYDSSAKAYYIYDSENKIFISYDDSEAIKAKCDFVIDNGYGGIMYWSYTDDMTGTLMNALYEKLEDMKK